jgi:hypothetical protein
MVPRRADGAVKPSKHAVDWRPPPEIGSGLHFGRFP